MSLPRLSRHRSPVSSVLGKNRMLDSLAVVTSGHPRRLMEHNTVMWLVL